MGQNTQNELADLGVYVTKVIAGVLPVPVNVMTHDWDGIYNGVFPFILVRPYLGQTSLLNIGQPGRRGTDAARPVLHEIQLGNQVDARGKMVTTGEGLLAACERQLEKLWDAIDDSFDDVAHWTGSGGAFVRLGFATKIQFSKPFKVAQDGATRVVAEGILRSVGQPHLGVDTRTS